MSVKINGLTGIEFTSNTQQLKFKGDTQNFNLKTVGDDFNIYNNDVTKLWGMSSTGLESKPNVPAFFAKRTDAASFGGNAIFVFNLVEYDNTNSYSGTTGLFTAPISGFYHFTTTLVGTSGGDRTLIQFRVNGGIAGYLQHLQSVYSNQEPANTTSITYYLNNGDTMEIYVLNTVRTNISNVNHFSGHFVG